MYTSLYLLRLRDPRKFKMVLRTGTSSAAVRRLGDQCRAALYKKCLCRMLVLPQLFWPRQGISNLQTWLLFIGLIGGSYYPVALELPTHGVGSSFQTS